jgi:hypothetical protein
MASSGVVEPIDVPKDYSFSLPPCCPFLPPDQLRYEALEERLDRSVVLAITLAAHRRTQAMGLQRFFDNRRSNIGFRDRNENGSPMVDYKSARSYLAPGSQDLCSSGHWPPSPQYGGCADHG